MQRTGIIKIHSNRLSFADLVGFQISRASNKLCFSVVGGETMGQSRSATERIRFEKYKEMIIRRYSSWCMVLLGIYLPSWHMYSYECMYIFTYCIFCTLYICDLVVSVGL